MIQLLVELIKELIKLLSSIGTGFISVYTGLRTEVPRKRPLLNIPRLFGKWLSALHAICTFHTITSFVNVPCEAQEQSKALYILSHAFYFGMSTHAKRIKSWLHEAKKTCQAHFLGAEAKLKNTCGYFAHQFVIYRGSDLTISI